MLKHQWNGPSVRSPFGKMYLKYPSMYIGEDYVNEGICPFSVSLVVDY
jgi:hypothetical protein